MPRTTFPHLRLQFGGTLGTANAEIWSCTIKLCAATGGTGGIALETGAVAATTVSSVTAGDLTTAAAAMFGHLVAFHHNWGMDAATLNYAKLNPFGSDDLQSTAFPTIDHQAAGSAGGLPSSCAWSTAAVFEHRTSQRSRGFASHGRISYPGALAITESTGKLANVGGGTLTSVASAYAALLKQLATDSPGDQFYPSIVYTSQNPAKPAAASPITSVILSDIPGEIRRRQNKLRQGSAPVAVP